MRESKSNGPTSTDRGPVLRRCCPPGPEYADDAELNQLFNDLAQTLFNVMAYRDADILMRYELRGQSLFEIANDIGCSQGDATRQLTHAQRRFCERVVLTLMPRKLE